MRANFIATLALAVLLTGGSAVVAMVQPASSQPAAFTCRAPAPNESGYGSRELSLQVCQDQQASVPDPGVANPPATNDSVLPTYPYGGFAPDAGFTAAHQRPHGRRYW